MPQHITASAFKATCLGILDDVARTGEEIIVTKHGRPVAKLVPIDPAPDLRGSVTYLVDDEELLSPLGDVWDADHR